MISEQCRVKNMPRINAHARVARCGSPASQTYARVFFSPFFASLPFFPFSLYPG